MAKLSTTFWLSASKALKFISLPVCVLLVAVSVGLSPAMFSKGGVNIPIHVIGQIRLDIPDDRYDEYKQMTATLFLDTMERDRPTLYTCNRDIYDPNLFVWNEEWSSYEALQRHFESPHFKTWYSYAKTYQVGELNVIYAPISAFRRTEDEQGI